MAVSDPDFWGERALSVRRNQLETVRAAASSWKNLFSAVLGAFSAAAFAGGLPTLTKLTEPLQTIVKAATLVAVVAFLGATVFSSLAAGAGLRLTSDQSWQGTQADHKSAAALAIKRLDAAKLCGVIAAVLVLAGSAVIFWVGEAAPKPQPPTVVAVLDGNAVCGKLAASTGGALMAGTVPLTKVDSLMIVATCP